MSKQFFFLSVPWHEREASSDQISVYLFNGPLYSRRLVSVRPVTSNQVLVRTEGHLRYENLSRKNVPKHHTSLKALPY